MLPDPCRLVSRVGFRVREGYVGTRRSPPTALCLQGREGIDTRSQPRLGKKPCTVTDSMGGPPPRGARGGGGGRGGGRRGGHGRDGGQPVLNSQQLSTTDGKDDFLELAKSISSLMHAEQASHEALARRVRDLEGALILARKEVNDLRVRNERLTKRLSRSEARANGEDEATGPGQ